MQVREAGDELIVEVSGHDTRPGSDAPFNMQYVWFITHENGCGTRFRDYMNPLRLRSA
jgi:ketosteroid isomerase-like protein